MDRSVYVAMSGAQQILNALAANNNNLANANTTGFRADLTAFQTENVVGAGLPVRAYATASNVGFDSSAGSLDHTGRPLDVAINGAGWIAVQATNGTEAYTRAGDLHVAPSGVLMNAQGDPVLGGSGPITVPPHNSISVGEDGSVSIVPIGQSASTVTTIGRIKLVNPPDSALVRGSDGLFRLSSGGSAAADASVRLLPGTLESSNVNIAETMVNMIALQRSYELQVRAMRTAKNDASSSAKLLQSS